MKRGGGYSSDGTADTQRTNVKERKNLVVRGSGGGKAGREIRKENEEERNVKRGEI